jgi:hypothetical protein
MNRGSMMNISTQNIVSNSEIIKNYKTCRDKTGVCGKLFIFKNNQPDAVLFSIAEYDELSALVELFDGLEEKEIIRLMESVASKAL